MSKKKPEDKKAEQTWIQIGVRDEMGWAPIHQAASDGDEQGVIEYVKAGADVNMPIKSKDHFDGCVPVFLAISCGHVNTLYILARLGANLNIKVNGISAVVLAMQHGSKAVELVETLIGMGADVSFIKRAVDEYGHMILSLTGVKKSFIKKLGEMFKDPGAVKKKYASEYDVSPIYFDIKEVIDAGDVALVRYVTDSSISETDKYATNLFVEIALRGVSTNNIVMMVALIKAGYDISRVNENEASAYSQITQSKGKLNGFALCLLGANSDISDQINAIGDDGMNDVHRAIKGGNEYFLCVILSLGGDANVPMQDGTLPISLVMQSRFNIEKMFYVLVKSGAKIDVFDIETIQNLVDQRVINPDSAKYLKIAQSGPMQFLKMDKLLKQLEKSFWQKIMLLDQAQVVSAVEQSQSGKVVDIDMVVSESNVFKETLLAFSKLDIGDAYTKFRAVDSDDIKLVGDGDMGA